MTSPEKVAAALDNAEALADDENAESSVKAMSALLGMGRGYIERSLPADPEQLDQLLEQGARWFLSMRSDDAEPAELSA